MNVTTSVTIIACTFILAITAGDLATKLVPPKPEPVVVPESLEDRIKWLETRSDQNTKNWDSLLNYFCLDIKHFADNTQVMVYDKNPKIGLDPGRCQPGFKN